MDSAACPAPSLPRHGIGVRTYDVFARAQWTTYPNLSPQACESVLSAALCVPCVSWFKHDVTNLVSDYIRPVGMTRHWRAKYHFSTRYSAIPMSSRIDTLIQSSPCDCATSHTQIASAMIGTV